MVDRSPDSRLCKPLAQADLWSGPVGFDVFGLADVLGFDYYRRDLIALDFLFRATCGQFGRSRYEEGLDHGRPAIRFLPGRAWLFCPSVSTTLVLRLSNYDNEKNSPGGCADYGRVPLFGQRERFASCTYHRSGPASKLSMRQG